MTLDEIITLLPAGCTTKELTITNQLLIYGDSERFTETRISELITSINPYYSDCEIAFIKKGWKYTNLLVINNYGLGNTPEIRHDDINPLIAQKVITTYAHQKEKDRIDTMISQESSSAYNDSYGSFKYAQGIEKALKDFHKVTANGVIQQITSFKKLTRQQQRQEIYTTLDCLDEPFFGQKITPAEAEILLRDIANIDEQSADFQVTPNKIKMKDDKFIKKYSVLPSQPSPSSYTSLQGQSMFFSNEINEKEVKINKLELTIHEFNEKYQGHFSITKRDRFWDVLDLNLNTIQGHLYNLNGDLIETPFSEGKYGFIKHLLSNPITVLEAPF